MVFRQLAAIVAGITSWNSRPAWSDLVRTRDHLERAGQVESAAALSAIADHVRQHLHGEPHRLAGDTEGERLARVFIRVWAGEAEVS